MRYERRSRCSNTRDDIALAGELLSSGVPQSRVKEIFKNRIDEVDLDNVMDDSRDYGGSTDNFSPDIKRLVEEAKAPKHFLDPLYMQLMKDPVVVSSGYTMDRSTVLDRDGNLRFSRCPFSGKRLNSEVYPSEMKSQIEYFRMKRDSNITQIARKLIAGGKYDSFNDLLGAIEVYLQGLGENYLPLARELAAVWSGVRLPPTFMMLVESLNINATDKWVTAVESSRLEDSIYKIVITTELFRDLGKGSRKSFIALSLYDDMGELVERCKLFDGSHHGVSKLNRVFDKRDKIIVNALPGYTYRLEYMVGSNQNYVQIEGLIVKIFPKTHSSSSYRMRDQEGEEGLYIGPTDSQRLAHGQGSLEYDNGTRFVGRFEHGSMVDGVFYRGAHIRRTMTRGKWTRGIDEVQVEKYPSNMVVYDSACDSNRLDLEESIRNIDELFGDGANAGHYESRRSNQYKLRYDDKDDFVSLFRRSGRHHDLDRNSYYREYDDLSTSRHSRLGRPSSFDEIESQYHVKETKALLKDISTVSRKPRTFDDSRTARSYKAKGSDEQSKHRTRSKSIDVGDIFPDLRNRDDRSTSGQIRNDITTSPDFGRNTGERYKGSRASHLNTDDLSIPNAHLHFTDRKPGSKLDHHFDKYSFQVDNGSVGETSKIDHKNESRSYLERNRFENASSPSVRSYEAREAEFLDNLEFDFEPPQVPTHKPGSKSTSSIDSSARSATHGGRKSRSFTALHEEDDLMRKLTIEKTFSSESRIMLPKGSRPYILHVPLLQRKLKKGGEWIAVTTSGYLEDHVKYIMFSVEEYLDQKKKCNLGIALYDETGKFVVRCNVFGNRTKSKGHFRMITDEEKVVSKARPGYFYQLQYAVNSGSVDVLQVKGWICKIFSASKTLPSTTMVDKDGDKGTYFGPVSIRGEAHGKGYLEYHNGCTFVGQFSQGNMMHGSYYKIDQIKGTMINGEWTDEIAPKMYHLYPSSVQIFIRDVRSEDIIYVDSGEDREEGSCCLAV